MKVGIPNCILSRWKLPIVLVGVIVAIMLMFVRLPLSGKRDTECRMTALGYAIGSFQRDCGFYPRDDRKLTELFVDPGVPGWSGPYLGERELLLDAWGTPMKYLYSGTGIRLVSSGPDGDYHTEDDIVKVINIENN